MQNNNIFKKSKTAQKKDDSGIYDKKGKKIEAPKKKVAKQPERVVKASDMYDMINDSDEEQNSAPNPQAGFKKFQKPSNDSDSENSEQSDDENAENMEMEHGISSKLEASSTKKMKEMLPIKTKAGLVPRLEEVQKFIKKAPAPVEDEDSDLEDEGEQEVDDNADSDLDILDTFNEDKSQPKKRKMLSATELLLERENEVQRQRFRIGVISAGILEKPEEKVKNLGVLLGLMEDYSNNEKNLLSTRKLAMISLVEVFKDIIPDYKVGIVDLEAQKVKKDTLNRVSYENELLKYYKTYLRDLENCTKALKRRKYGPKFTQEQKILGEISIQCLCEALHAHPYFNFGTNIAQVLVVFLNSGNEAVRKRVYESFMQFFKSDKRLDVTRHIVRHINHLVKKKSSFVFTEVISCLTALPIKSINVDQEKEAELKQKKMEQRKSRLISMSKRERKRTKKLVELEKEMMETQAEENKNTKNTKLTDVAKLVFTIYFRILKQYPNSRLLSATLEGLAKFAHIINIEFFADLIEVLNHLIENVDLGYREQLHCIQTVFTILSGQGEVLNIDPARFYTHLYASIMRVNAGKNHTDMESIITTLENVLIRRRKNITNLRYLAFLKRLMSLSLQALHNGTLSCLSIVKSAMQMNASLDILLDTETKIGSGKFDPEIVEPEFSNANCTSLFELGLLRRHYHPTVVKMANHIAAGVQINSGILEPTLSKM